jgi:hypothetical protein
MNKSFGVVARVKVPKGCVGIWVNIYLVGKRLSSGGAYKRRVDADRVAKSYRHDCVYTHVRKHNEIQKP